MMEANENVGTNFVNGLELLCDSKDSLNVVVAQLLNQVSNRGIVLKKQKKSPIYNVTQSAQVVMYDRSQSQ